MKLGDSDISFVVGLMEQGVKLSEVKSVQSRSQEKDTDMTLHLAIEGNFQYLKEQWDCPRHTCLISSFHC